MQRPNKPELSNIGPVDFDLDLPEFSFYEHSIDIDIPPQFPEPLNSLLVDIASQRATDIHLDPTPTGQLTVRFRVDGIAHIKEQLSQQEGGRLLNQIKVASKIDIEKLFSPIESQLCWTTESGKKDIRVVVTPAGNAEAIHLRVMTVPEKIHDVTKLGFSDKHLAICQETMNTPSGLVLVTGATGAGKSSTLYGLASMLDLETKIGMSIEDPIEYNMPNLRQLQVDNGHGLTMNEGLRTILRMDPDVILVGEIRDEQSAMTAARAAMAGRLVIATLHAADAASAVEALQYLSVPSYIIGSTLRLVISQSLVRRLCMGCSTPRELTKQEEILFDRMDMIEPEHVFDPVGCPECSSYGYKGRLGIFEMAQITAEIAEKISTGVTKHQMKELFRQNGTKPIILDALTKAAFGHTSMQEIYQSCWKDVSQNEQEPVQVETHLKEWAQIADD